MRDWKRIVKTLIVVSLLVLLGVESYMEVHFSTDEVVLKSEDAAAILRGTPKAEIAEEDKAFLEEIFRRPSVQGLLDGGENGVLYAADDQDMKAAAERYLSKDGVETLSASVAIQENGKIGTLRLHWLENEKEVFYLQQTGDGEETGYYKLYAVDGLFGGRTVYDNWDNERATEHVIRRRWFAWLRDRMGENA